MVEDKSSVLLTDANLVDVVTGTVFTASILITEGFISDIFRNKLSEEIQFDSDVLKIDAKNKWVIPGLIDMHVHIKEGFAPLFVASGVTTVRNTGGNVLELKKLKDAPSDAPTPRIYSADRVIDGPPGLWGETGPWNINIDEVDAARAEVIRQIKAGADFIKVYGWLSKEMMEVVVQEAKRYGKEVSCDLIHSTKVNAVVVGEIGVKWNEHASGIIQAMYPEWNMQADQHIWNTINWEAPDLDKIKIVCSKLIKLGIIICPTMTLFDQMNLLQAYWKPNNVVTQKIDDNTSMINQWQGFSKYEDALKQMGIQNKINKAIAKTYFELGGTVVAGTDTPAGVWTLPGMALHRELELFVEAGFSEIDALRAATCVAAEAINQSDIGVIKVGAKGDLVVLNSNPLEDIKNTKNIEFVIKGGKILSQLEILDSVPNEESTKIALEEFIKSFNESIL